MSDVPALSVLNLRKSFTSGGRVVIAADDVSFDVAAGETLALAGPSGSGKSTVARLITRIIEPEAGELVLAGEDFRSLRGSELRHKRRHLQIVFQDTTAAFSPRATVEGVINDPLRIHNLRPHQQRRERVAELLSQVGLDPVLMVRATHELSGGQRQRVAIARALACEPAVIILDEALSAVDASRRVELIDLLIGLQRQRRIAYLFIAHDLGLIRAMAHRIAILDNGRIVETGPTGAVIDNPQSTMGRALVAAAPRLENAQ